MKKFVLLSVMIIFSPVFTGCGFLPFVGGGEESTSTEEVLKKALQDRNPVVRKDAVRLLGGMVDTPENQMWSARVLAIALKDKNEDIRMEAVKTLGNIDPKYSNRHLKEALNDRSVKVRVLVVQVMKEMNDKRIAGAGEAVEEAEEASGSSALLPTLVPEEGGQ